MTHPLDLNHLINQNKNNNTTTILRQGTKPHQPTHYNTPIVEPYPTELLALKQATTHLQKKYRDTTITPTTRTQFENEARETYEKAGFTIHINWTLTPLKNNETLATPQITITGRTNNNITETDHTQYAQEVQAGYADGKTGTLTQDKQGNPQHKNT